MDVYALLADRGGAALAFLGLIFEGEFQSNYDWTWFHWWMLVIVGLPIIAAIGYSGIALSIETIVVVGAAEFLIVLALGLWGLADPGPGGFTLSSFTYGFDPGNIATATGFSLAIVFTVQGLTGWEAAVPLAEETENPRRNVPRATMASIVIIGLMLVLVIWGQVIGWGTKDLNNLISSEELPALVLSHRFWGSLWWLALLAMFTSVIGASLAVPERRHAHVVRHGPKRRAAVGVREGRPPAQDADHAITAQFILSLVLGLGLCQWLGPADTFILFLGFMLVISVIFVYIVANLAVVLYYWREARSEFNWIFHAIFPIGTSAVLIYSLYKSFDPFPAHPYNWSPFICAGWLIAGIGVLLWLRSRGEESWLAKAGAVVEERMETTDELQHRPVL